MEKNTINTPKISVIIPTYNRGDLLKKSINSVLSQTYENFELIIVDDGSTDTTREVTENYIKNDKRIVYLYEANSGGPAHPKNVGVKKALGEFISFLDDDDEWLPEKLEKQIQMFETPEGKNIDIVSCDSIVEDNVSGIIVKPSKIKNYKLCDLLIKNSIFTGTVLVRASSLKNKLFDENLKFLEDWDMWIRILSENNNIKFVPIVLFKYKISNLNTTKKIASLQKIEAQIYVFKKNITLYKKYNISHIIMFQIGVKFYLENEYEQAKTFFKQSIVAKNAYLLPYLGYFISFLGNFGKPIIKLAIQIKRFVSNDKWGYKFN